MRACGRADCVAVVWGFSGVGAVAANRVAYGWGWEKNVSRLAEEEAIRHCQSRTPAGESGPPEGIPQN